MARQPDNCHLQNAAGPTKVVLQHAAHPQSSEIPRQCRGSNRRPAVVSCLQATVAASYNPRHRQPPRDYVGPCERGPTHKITPPNSHSHPQCINHGPRRFLEDSRRHPPGTSRQSLHNHPELQQPHSHSSRPTQRWTVIQRAPLPHTPLLELQVEKQTKIQAQNRRTSQRHSLLLLKVRERNPKMYRQKDSTCFFIVDERSNTELLVNTGTFKSFVPVNRTDASIKPPAPYRLPQPVEPVENIREKDHKVLFGRKQYNWTFVSADVTITLLGADFLKAHNMLEFPEVFKDDLQHNLTRPSKHHVQHHIVTESPPVHACFRSLAPEILAHAKEAFQDVEQAGMCQKAFSPWASLLHMVLKPDGTWRPCSNYWRLNIKTVPDRYPLPNIADITRQMEGAKIFTKIDLLKGYFQVLVAKDDIEKMTVNTPFRTYTFNYSCFGLRNSGATFQRLMDEILDNLPFCIIYVDDILIFSPDIRQQMRDVRRVLHILKENGLIKVQKDQCEWAQPEVEFLGYQISPNSVKPLTTKFQAITDFLKPRTAKAVQEFMGIFNYYHHFIPSFAESFTLTMDVSSTVTGVLLEQDTGDGHHPLASFSKKLLPEEQKGARTRNGLVAKRVLVTNCPWRNVRNEMSGTNGPVTNGRTPNKSTPRSTELLAVHRDIHHF
ncbi:uncharacterized protein [Macrobrachium rosenbergii]|uniref:uncharacterized protein n=1 Tax=Macrobrachium rosenbergii TaxID=79674 RepID=UPI0034D79977